MNVDAQILRHIVANQIRQCVKSGIHPRCARLAQLQSVNAVRHMNRLQKDHVIISGAVEKLLEFGRGREEF